MKIRCSGIDCGNYELINNDSENNYLSFLIRDDKTKCFIIKRCKLR